MTPMVSVWDDVVFVSWGQEVFRLDEDGSVSVQWQVPPDLAEPVDEFKGCCCGEC